MDWIRKVAGALGIERGAAAALASFTKDVPIARARAGKRTRVTGVVQALEDGTTESPSGRQVVGWLAELRAFRRTTTESGAKIWKSVWKAEGGLPFVLQDDTGALVVEPQEASPLLVTKETDYTSSREAISSGVERLASQAHASFDGNLKYAESCIAVGDELEVVGIAKLWALSGPAAGYRGERGETLVVDSEQEPVVFREV